MISTVEELRTVRSLLANLAPDGPTSNSAS